MKKRIGTHTVGKWEFGFHTDRKESCERLDMQELAIQFIHWHDEGYQEFYRAIQLELLWFALRIEYHYQSI